MSAVLKEVTTDPVETPATQTIVLPVTETLMAGIRPAGAVVEANAWEIDSADMAQLAAAQRTTWAKRIDQIKAMRKDFVEPAQAILERAKKWFTPPIEDLEGGREILGRKLLAWDEKEKARIAAERAAREAEERRIRQEAEAKAAAERARAEETARIEREKAAKAEAERKRQAEEAERLRREGDAKAAAEADRKAKAAAAEAAKAQEREQAAIENGEAKAQTAQLEAAAQVQAAPEPAVVKIAGQAVKDNWVAEMAPGLTEEKALALIVAEAGARPDLLGLLKLDTSAVNKMAKALKTAMRVPGFVAVNRPQIAGARK